MVLHGKLITFDVASDQKIEPTPLKSLRLSLVKLGPSHSWLSVTNISSTNRVSLFRFCNTGSIRDDPYWTSRNNSLEMTELPSINKVSLV